MAEFGPLFDEMNFSDALKSLWALVAETDGYLTAHAPWKKPAERTDADHAALQARVLSHAAEAIRVITALVYPILPVSASKVWQQLGLGDLQAAAKKAFLKDLAWGGLKPGTKFGEPAPLFPRAEKDATERMENLERENNASAVDAASGERSRDAACAGGHVSFIDGGGCRGADEPCNDADDRGAARRRAAGGHGQGARGSPGCGLGAAEDVALRRKWERRR